MAVLPIQAAPRSHAADRNDDQQARWGQQRHEGFPLGRYLQTPPLIFTADHHPVWMVDTFRGRSAFLICGGPSVSSIDLQKLRRPGLLTMGLNNAVRSFRPNLWVCVDSPDHFMLSIWLDPAITKFAPICHTGKPIFDNIAWRWTSLTVRDCPNVFYYKRNEHFQPQQFLWEDTINWGDHKKYGGGRSVMLPAIRLLFILGVRRVFLLGADFKMSQDCGYHFEQGRSPGSIRGNNSTYEKLNARFKKLRPLFDRERFHVLNTNPHSGLRAFDFIGLDEAIDLALGEFNHIDVGRERTAGLYDQEKPPR